VELSVGIVGPSLEDRETGLGGSLAGDMSEVLEEEAGVDASVT
jgi:hypothetical protein